MGRDRRTRRAGWTLLGTAGVLLGAALGPIRAQAPAPRPGDPNQAAARVERAQLNLIAPDRFLVPMLLEPLRKVSIMTTADGILRTIEVNVGTTVRDGQVVAQLDDAEAAARVRVAKAQVKEKQAQLKGGGKEYQEYYQAQIEAANAEVELAQLARDRCTLRAPFPGVILAAPVSVGQYLNKGATVLELADVSSLRVLMPVDKSAVKVGDTINVFVEGQAVPGKVLSILPLVESFASLRELASPLSAAWVTIANPGNSTYEPGQRVQSPYTPQSPVANVPSYAIKTSDPEGVVNGPIVQVIRNEHVANVPVKILGNLGPDRSQISGTFRPTDVLITNSSLPLRPGTFLRFANEAPSGIEATPPDPSAIGEPARVSADGVAPIGSPGPVASPGRERSTKKAAPAAKAGGVPF